ncbi:MAG: ComEC/Rec2 family competence protein [Prevotella sp.]
MKTNGKIQLYPVLRIALSLVLGIMAGDVLYGKVSLSVWFFILASSFVCCYVVRKKPIACSIMIFVTFFLLGASLLCHRRNTIQCPLPTEKTLCQAVVASKPQFKGKTVRCDLIVIMPERTLKVRACFFRDKRAELLNVGDGIQTFMSLKEPYNYIGATFDYRRYLFDHGYSATSYLNPFCWYPAHVDLGSLTTFDKVRIFALRLRESMLDHYRNIDDRNSAAVISAMVFGDKSALSVTLKEAYSVSGVAHVLALSGLHLAIIFAVLSVLLYPVRKRIVSNGFIIVAIWMYVFIVGLSVSVLRSALMLTIYTLVNAINRDKMSLNALSVAAVIICIANPLAIYDVGFQMSFAAVLFINVFYRRIYSVMSERIMEYSPLRWLWQLCSVSIAAQIGVAPLILYYFGRFSCYFLITNIFVVPLVTAIIYIAVMSIPLMLVPQVCSLFTECVVLLVSFLNKGVFLIASLPGASVDYIYIGKFQLVALYVAVFMALISLHYVKKTRF